MEKRKEDGERRTVDMRPNHAYVLGRVTQHIHTEN